MIEQVYKVRNKIFDTYNEAEDYAISLSKPLTTTYEILNFVGETKQKVTGLYNTLDEAKLALKSKSNWYRPLGTGQIDKIDKIEEFISEDGEHFTKRTTIISNN